VLGQPLGDAPGVARGGALALDEGDDLVLVAHQALEEAGGGIRQARGDGPDALPGDAQEVALGDGADVAHARPHRPGDLAGHHVGGGLGHLGHVGVGVGLRVVRHERGEALGDAAGRHHPDHLVGGAVDLLGHGDDVLVVG
jgi:hypothetical protein